VDLIKNDQGLNPLLAVDLLKKSRFLGKEDLILQDIIIPIPANLDPVENHFG
jgi:hypothetical protein